MNTIILTPQPGPYFLVNGKPVLKDAWTIEPSTSISGETRVNLIDPRDRRLLSGLINVTEFKAADGTTFTTAQGLVDWVNGNIGSAGGAVLLAPANNAIMAMDLTNTLNIRGQASRQLRLYQKDTLGAPLVHLDITGLLDTGMLSVISRKDNGSDYPQFLSFSVPEHLRSNGIVIRGNNSGGTGHIKYQWFVKGACSAAPVAANATGKEDWIMVDEIMGTTGAPPVALRHVLLPNNSANPTRFFSGGVTVWADPRSVAVEWGDHVGDNGLPGFPPGPMQGKKFAFIRVSGDFHFGGTQYLSNTSAAANSSLTLDKEVFQYTGAGGDTLTLPDPAVADSFGVANAYSLTGKENQGRTHILVNMGTGDLTLSRPVYLDGVTNTTTLTFAHPSNKLRIMSDGTRWIAIL